MWKSSNAFRIIYNSSAILMCFLRSNQKTSYWEFMVLLIDAKLFFEENFLKQKPLTQCACFQMPYIIQNLFVWKRKIYSQPAWLFCISCIIRLGYTFRNVGNREIYSTTEKLENKYTIHWIKKLLHPINIKWRSENSKICKFHGKSRQIIVRLQCVRGVYQNII